jgi:hypothetical protein
MPRWVIQIERRLEQDNGERRRTVGSYCVFHDDQRVDALFGVTAESPGPSENDRSATSRDPRRILPGEYQLSTHEGAHYATIGYRDDPVHPEPLMPGLLLLGTGKRKEILIHPGKNEFLSSIGCINPCTALPNASELIDFTGSRARVVALIDDLRATLGAAFPTRNDRPIRDAWVVIKNDPRGLN